MCFSFPLVCVWVGVEGRGGGGERVGCSAGSTFLTVPDMSKINSPSGK